MSEVHKPRVFVSSVMTGFEAFRNAARDGVTSAGGAPILIEDFPSLDMSSRTACLDLVRSCDIYLLIVGDRLGSSPLGKPVIEEEMEEARKRKLPRLLFLHEIARDPEAETFANQLSDYFLGRFRVTFSTPDELKEAVASALAFLLEQGTMQLETNDPNDVNELLETASDAQGAFLRLCVIPERKLELFDVLELEDPAFRRTIFQLGHRNDVLLFDYDQGQKTATADRGYLVVRQERGRSDSANVEIVVRLGETGTVTIDQSIDRRHKNRNQPGMGFDIQIAEADIAEAVGSSISFVNVLYDQYDPGHRFATFFYGVALSGMGIHVVVKEIRHQEGWTLGMDDHHGWHALDRPRRIDRTDLANPLDVINRTLAFVTKRYGEKRG